MAAGGIDADTLDHGLTRIARISDPVAAAAEVDIVSESVPEDPVLKGRVLDQCNELCPERAAPRPRPGTSRETVKSSFAEA